MMKDGNIGSENSPISHYFPIKAATILRVMPLLYETPLNSLSQTEGKQLDEKMMQQGDHYLWLPWKVNQDMLGAREVLHTLIGGYVFAYMLIHDQSENNKLPMPIINKEITERHYTETRSRHTGFPLSQIVDRMRVELQEESLFATAVDTLAENSDFKPLPEIFKLAAYDGNLFLRRVILEYYNPSLT